MEILFIYLENNSHWLSMIVWKRLYCHLTGIFALCMWAYWIVCAVCIEGTPLMPWILISVFWHQCGFSGLGRIWCHMVCNPLGSEHGVMVMRRENVNRHCRVMTRLQRHKVLNGVVTDGCLKAPEGYKEHYYIPGSLKSLPERVFIVNIFFIPILILTSNLTIVFKNQSSFLKHLYSIQ